MKELQRGSSGNTSRFMSFRATWGWEGVSNYKSVGAALNARLKQTKLKKWSTSDNYFVMNVESPRHSNAKFRLIDAVRKGGRSAKTAEIFYFFSLPQTAII